MREYILYIVNDDSYDSYDFVDDIIVVVAASMINDNIYEIIKEHVEKTFFEILSNTFSDSF